jgi:hypothetical protein
MFALGFWCSVDEGYDENEWSIEDVTADFDEAVDNLFFARNSAAAGNDHWQGSRLMISVLRDGKTTWEPLSEGTYAE